MKKLYFLLFQFIAVTTYAQWTTDTTANTVVRDSTGVTPLMATTNDGKTYVCWFESGPTANYDLHMQLLDEHGNKQWAPEGIVVSNLPQNSALYRYDMKLDNNDNAIVAFQDERMGSLQIVAYKIDINGNSLWQNGIVLIDSISPGGLGPVIGITESNNVAVAWTCSGNYKSIAVQKISSAGTVLWNEPFRVIDSVGSLSYSRPQLLAWKDDGIQLMYVEESGSFPGVTSTLYLQRIDQSGVGLLSTPVQISTKTIPYFIFPVAVADDAFGLYVAFNTSNPVNASLIDVYVQHVDSAGNLWSATGTEAANSTTNNKLASGSCYVNGNGEFWVLLQILDNSQSLSGVSLQKFDATGNVMLGQDGLSVITMDADYYLPHTINDAGDGIIFSVGYGNSVSQRLFAMKTDYNGSISWPGINSPLCAVLSGKDDVTSGKFINDNLVFVWYDDRNTNGIFAQNIDGNGNVGVFTGIEKTDMQTDIVLYPNPSDVPQLLMKEHSKGRIKVIDARGSVVFEKEFNSSDNFVSLSEFKQACSGFYTVQVKTEKSVQNIRWIKNN